MQPRATIGVGRGRLASASLTRGINKAAATTGPGVAGNNGIRSVQPGAAGQLEMNERGVAATAPTLTNGMVAPWMWNAADNQFPTYGEFGFTHAGIRLVHPGVARLSNIVPRTALATATPAGFTLAGTISLSTTSVLERGRGCGGWVECDR